MAASWDPKERWEATYPDLSKWEEHVPIEDSRKVTCRTVCEVMAQAQTDGLVNGGAAPAPEQKPYYQYVVPLKEEPSDESEAKWSAEIKGAVS